MGGAGLFSLRGSAPAVKGLRILSNHEHRTLAALARALFPSDGPIAIPGLDLELSRAFDGFLADEPPWNQADLKKALLLLELGPLVFDRRLATFSNLSEPERLAHFAAWLESKSELRRQAGTAFKKFLHLVFYDSPKSWPGIGYDGPLIRLEEPR